MEENSGRLWLLQASKSLPWEKQYRAVWQGKEPYPGLRVECSYGIGSHCTKWRQLPLSLQWNYWALWVEDTNVLSKQCSLYKLPTSPMGPDLLDTLPKEASVEDSSWGPIEVAEQWAVRWAFCPATVGDALENNTANKQRRQVQGSPLNLREDGSTYWAKVLFQAAHPANYIKTQSYQRTSSVQINSTNFSSVTWCPDLTPALSCRKWVGHGDI